MSGKSNSNSNNTEKMENDDEESNVNLDGHSNIPNHFWDVSDVDTLHKFILDYQNPIDQGLAQSVETLNTWTLEELQCAATILAGPAFFYGDKIPVALGAVNKPDQDTITQQKAQWMKEQRERFLHIRNNKGNNNDKDKSPDKSNGNKQSNMNDNDKDDNKQHENGKGKMGDFNEFGSLSGGNGSVTTGGSSLLGKRFHSEIRESDGNRTFGNLSGFTFSTRTNNGNSNNNNSNYNDNSNNNGNNFSNFSNFGNGNNNSKSNSNNNRNRNGFNQYGVRFPSNNNNNQFSFNNNGSMSSSSNNNNNADFGTQAWSKRRRANNIKRAMQQLLRNGKFKNYQEYRDPDGSITYIACDGDKLITTSERPCGYDPNDDVFNQHFLDEINHRPFHEFWSRVSGHQQKTQFNRVCITLYS